MRKLYGSTSWRRVLALVLVFVMMFSVMGTSGYSVFAEGLEETGEAVVEPAAEEPAQEEEFTPQGESPGEEDAEAVVETEEGEVEVEAVEEAEEEAEEPAEEAVEEAAEDEESEELAEAVEEEAEEGEELEAEPAEETEEEAEEPAEEPAEEEGEEEETLIAEAAQIIVEDDGELAPEEEAVEELPEEEVISEGPTSFPSKRFGDTVVSVSAEPYTFPEGTTVTIEEVTLGRTQINAVTEAVEEKVTVIKAYDITFYDVDGNEIQPAIPVKVSIVSDAMAEANNLQVVHMEDRKTAEVVEATVTDEGLEFDAEHFSIYVVVEADVPRLTLVFKNGDTELASMIVKAADTQDELETIVYDPGVGDIANNEVFYGWTKDKNYTEDSALFTIDQVRSAAKTAAASLTGDDSVTYYAALYKQYSVKYIDENGISQGAETAEVPSYITTGEAAYKVNMGYTPESTTQNFEGWLVSEGTSNIKGYPAGAKEETIEGVTHYYYENGTDITITGNVTFSVNAPDGHWLVFDEVGKGATYNAPQFVLSGEVTKDDDLREMTRYGYKFEGWFYGSKDAQGNVTYGNAFSFGGELEQNTTIYAKWSSNLTANYTVLIWKQHISGTEYDFAESVTIENAAVGNTPSAVSVNNNTVKVDGTEYKWTGFHYSSNDQAGQTVATEGNTVVNVYFDRDEITLEFYVYQRAGYTEVAGTAGTAGWYYTSQNNNSQRYVYYNAVDGKWYTNRNRNWNWNTWSWDYTYSGTAYDVVYTYSNSREWVLYKSMTGLYGTTLVANGYAWPTEYDWYSSYNNNNQATGTRTTFLDAFIPTSSNTTIKFYADDPEGSRHIYFLKQNAAKTGYDIANTINTDATGFHLSDKYDGFKCVAWNTSNNTNTWTKVGNLMPQDDGNSYYDANPSQNGYQTASFPGSNLYVFFDRLSYPLNFMDGVYVDGNNNSLDEINQGQLKAIEDVTYGSNLSSYNKGGSTYYAPTHNGFVFEGWYLDDACTTPYTFTVMSEGGITVFAKWRQIQYRVFLHPNAGTQQTNPSLSWGKDEQGQEVKQEMSFRVSYGDTISVPTGTMDGYNFVGWYTDEACTKVFNAATKIFDSNATAYNKATDLTDKMDRWGVVGPGDGHDAAWNSDAIGYDDDGDENTPGVDRFWITKKVDLYAKWSAILIGADGINVTYDENVAGGGKAGSAPVDAASYVDSANVTAGAASKPNAPDEKRFSHWILQSWDNAAGEFKDTTTTVLPGGSFVISKDDAQVVERAGSTQEKPLYTYTVQLKAIYEDVEEEDPTFIYWYKNDGTDETYREDDPVQINAGVAIYGLGDGETIPSRENYVFKGWAKSATATTPWIAYSEETGYTYNEKTVTQVAADEKDPLEALYAVWEFQGATYTVKHYQQNVNDDDYTLFETEAGVEGLIGENTAAVAKTYPGFTAKAFQQAKIAADGSTVVEIYYDRNVWKVTYDYGTAPAGASALPEEKPYKFGAAVTVADDATAPGYTFSGWSRTDAFTMPNEDVTITGTWTAKGDTPYKVEHYLQDLPTEGTTAPGYTLKDTENLTGATGATANANQKTYEGFTFNAQAEGTLVSAPITGDGNLVLKLYYDRNLWKVTYTYAEGSPADAPAVPEEHTYAFGETVPAAAIPTMNDYLFGGWDGEVTTMPDHDVTVIGSWSKDEVPVEPVTYTIIYHSNYTSKVSTETDETVPVEEATAIVTFNSVKGANELKFSKTSPWTNGNTTYTFNSWNTKADGSGTTIPLGDYDGTGAVVQAEGSSSMASRAVRFALAMVATSSNGGTLELWAQWDESTSGGGNPSRPPRDPDPTPDPDPVVDPDEPIDDGDTPLAPAEIDEDTEIDDGETPLAPAEVEEDTEIDEEATPLSPFTGDERHTAVWGFVSLLSLAGIVVVTRKRREE